MVLLKRAGFDEFNCEDRVRSAPSGRMKSATIAPGLTVTFAPLVILSVCPARYITPDVVIVVFDITLLPPLPDEGRSK